MFLIIEVVECDRSRLFFFHADLFDPSLTSARYTNNRVFLVPVRQIRTTLERQQQKEIRETRISIER